MSIARHPVSYADFSSNPISQARDEISQARDVNVNAAARAAAVGPIVYRTIVRIYLNHTGEDPGSTAEIKSEIYFDDNNARLGYNEYSVNTDFSSNNGGLGILLVELSRDTLAAPANFNATAYEEGGFGSGDRYFVQRPIDFGKYPQFMQPGVWTWKQWNSSDVNYIGNVQWEVIAQP